VVADENGQIKLPVIVSYEQLTLNIFGRFIVQFSHHFKPMPEIIGMFNRKRLHRHRVTRTDATFPVVPPAVVSETMVEPIKTPCASLSPDRRGARFWRAVRRR
jgi:hypothetical protein